MNNISPINEKIPVLDGKTNFLSGIFLRWLKNISDMLGYKNNRTEDFTPVFINWGIPANAVITAKYSLFGSRLYFNIEINAPMPTGGVSWTLASTINVKDFDTPVIPLMDGYGFTVDRNAPGTRNAIVIVGGIVNLSGNFTVTPAPDIKVSIIGEYLVESNI